MHWIGLSYYFEHDCASTVATARQVIALHHAYPQPYRWHAAALDQLGRKNEARETLERAIAISPLGFDLYVPGRPPWLRPEELEHLRDGLRRAGWEG